MRQIRKYFRDYNDFYDALVRRINADSFIRTAKREVRTLVNLLEDAYRTGDPAALKNAINRVFSDTWKLWGAAPRLSVIIEAAVRVLEDALREDDPIAYEIYQRARVDLDLRQHIKAYFDYAGRTEINVIVDRLEEALQEVLRLLEQGADWRSVRDALNYAISWLGEVIHYSEVNTKGAAADVARMLDETYKELMHAAEKELEQMRMEAEQLYAQKGRRAKKKATA